MSQQAWFEHFEEQLQGLTEAFQQSGTSVSLLKYAFQEQRLSPETYLSWAQSHYLLPQLQSRFFTETPISQEMFAKWATHYPWSEECLPVAEWDGSLIVACLQPPQDFPTNPTAILVLASPEALHEAWKQLHPAKSKDAPEGIDLAAAALTPEPKSDGASFDDLGIQSSMNSEQPTAEESSEWAADLDEKLDGLFESATVVQLKPVIPQTAAPAQAPKPEPEESKVEMSEPEAATVVQVKVPVAKPLPVTAPEPAADSTLEKTVVAVMPRQAPPAKPKVIPVATSGFALEKIKMKNASVLNEKVKQALDEMQTHFQKSLILSLDEEETQLSVFAWDEHFQGMKDTSMRIPLKTPSIFNIVSSTQKPFHGFVSLNEINEKFFEDWNQGQVPDHVTITPLIVQDRLVGMLMGFAEKSAYNRATLNFTEKLSAEFVEGLKTAS